jgi:hypothetical protein
MLLPLSGSLLIVAAVLKYAWMTYDDEHHDGHVMYM